MNIFKKISATCLLFSVLACQSVYSSTIEEENDLQRNKACFTVKEAIAIGHVFLDGAVVTVHEKTKGFYQMLGENKLPVPASMYHIAQNLLPWEKVSEFFQITSGIAYMTLIAADPNQDTIAQILKIVGAALHVIGGDYTANEDHMVFGWFVNKNLDSHYLQTANFLSYMNTILGAGIVLAGYVEEKWHPIRKLGHYLFGKEKDD